MGPEKPPDNIINLDQAGINSAFQNRLEKSGEMGEIMADVGEQMAVHEERRDAGKETRGKWSIWVVDQEDTSDHPVRFIVGKDEKGGYVLLPNDAEHMHQEFIFSTDKEAEAAKTVLSQQFSDIKADNFRVLCGGVDEDQHDHPKLTVIKGGRA